MLANSHSTAQVLKRDYNVGNPFLESRRPLNRKRSMNFAKLLAVTLVASFSMLAINDSARCQDIHYQVTFPDAKAHYCEVQLTVDHPPAEMELMMPTWTPGSYLIREYARFIDQEKATNADGEEIPSQKVTKNRWKLTCGETEKVSFSYRLYCHELSVRTNWIDDELAVLNGAATFLVPVDRVEEKLDVKIVLPKNWPSSVCVLTESEEQPHLYLAENFHQLVDSPILCGDCHIHPFDVGGVPHALVNLGDDELWNAQQATNDLKKLVSAHHQFWGNIPYKKYLFLNIVRGGGGGLEHDNCTMIMSNRYTCRSDRSYKSWLTLASHEFFHTWNVRRLRPEVLTQYDYENEVYLRQLWIAEGITSYYENILAARAGLLNKNDLLSNLSKDIGSIESTPGNKVQSLSDSSFDTWIKFYRPHENSRNTTISYYSRGAVAAFMLDLHIRKATNNEKSLDDVMRAMYEAHVPSGYSSQQFRQTCSEIAGEDLSSWFEKHIDQPGDFDYPNCIDFLGLEFEPSRSGKELGIGASFSDSAGKTTVRSVAVGSPAHQAGLDTGDEIIALSDVRIDAAGFAREIKEMNEGDIIQLLIARRGKLKSVPVALESKQSQSFKLRDIKEASPEQDARQRDWLGLPAKEPEAKESETKKADESKPGEESKTADEASEGKETEASTQNEAAQGSDSPSQN